MVAYELKFHGISPRGRPVDKYRYRWDR